MRGFLLRAMKSDRYRYNDATNVVGYYADAVDAPEEFDGYAVDDVSGTVVIDPQTAACAAERHCRHDLGISLLRPHAQRVAAVRRRPRTLIKLVRTAARRHGEAFDGVDVVAHSMGGLVVREALRQLDEQEKGRPVP